MVWPVTCSGVAFTFYHFGWRESIISTVILSNIKLLQELSSPFLQKPPLTSSLALTSPSVIARLSFLAKIWRELQYSSKTTYFVSWMRTRTLSKHKKDSSTHLHYHMIPEITRCPLLKKEKGHYAQRRASLEIEARGYWYRQFTA